MKKVLKMDFLVLVCTFTLLGLGLFTLYSLTTANLESKQEIFYQEFVNQLIFAFTGLVFSIVIFLIPPIYFRFKLVLGVVYFITLVLLLYTAFFGLDIRGVRRWISFGGTVNANGVIEGGFTIQPSEFAKIVVIVMTAAFLSYTINTKERFVLGLARLKEFLIVHKYFLIAILLNLGIFISIYLQSSLSVASIIALIMVAVMFAGVKNKFLAFLIFTSFALGFTASQSIFFEINLVTRFLLITGALVFYTVSVFSKELKEFLIFAAIAAGLLSGSILLPFAWKFVVKDYQKDRIESFLHPDKDETKQSSKFQQEQSKISIGAGQIFGQGIKQISDSRLLSLPEPTTDFIFGIFAFKFGFIGSMIIIILYFLLITRLFYLADNMNDRFSSLVLIGVSSMILIQFFINLGMNLDILPVGGTTLPFMSAGGSSLISMMVGIAICQNIIATNRMEKNVYRRKDKVFIEGWNN
jgi:rod shape determining protein RodA